MSSLDRSPNSNGNSGDSGSVDSRGVYRRFDTTMPAISGHPPTEGGEMSAPAASVKVSSGEELARRSGFTGEIPTLPMSDAVTVPHNSEPIRQQRANQDNVIGPGRRVLRKVFSAIADPTGRKRETKSRLDVLARENEKLRRDNERLAAKSVEDGKTVDALKRIADLNGELASSRANLHSDAPDSGNGNTSLDSENAFLGKVIDDQAATIAEQERRLDVAASRDTVWQKSVNSILEQNRIKAKRIEELLHELAKARLAIGTLSLDKKNLGSALEEKLTAIVAMEESLRRAHDLLAITKGSRSIFEREPGRASAELDMVRADNAELVDWLKSGGGQGESASRDQGITSEGVDHTHSAVASAVDSAISNESPSYVHIFGSDQTIAGGSHKESGELNVEVTKTTQEEPHDTSSHPQHEAVSDEVSPDKEAFSMEEKSKLMSSLLASVLEIQQLKGGLNLYESKNGEVSDEEREVLYSSEYIISREMKALGLGNFSEFMLKPLLQELYNSNFKKSDYESICTAVSAHLAHLKNFLKIPEKDDKKPSSQESCSDNGIGGLSEVNQDDVLTVPSDQFVAHGTGFEKKKFAEGARERIKKGAKNILETMDKHPFATRMALSGALIGASLVLPAGAAALVALKLTSRAAGSYFSGKGVEKVLRARIRKMRESEDQKSNERSHKLERNQKVIVYGTMIASFLLGTTVDVYLHGSSALGFDSHNVGGSADAAAQGPSSSASRPDAVPPDASAEASSAPPVPAMHTVEKGETLGKLFKREEFSKLLPGFNDLRSEAARNNYLMNFFEKLTPEQLKAANISSGRVDEIMAGKQINMGLLAQYAENMRVAAKGDTLTLLQRALGIKN